MSKETFYFRHDYNSRTDRKLVNVIMKHGIQGIGVFWCVVEMLYEEGGYLPFEYERISFELRTDMEVIKSVINDFELFKYDTEKFWSDAVLDRLQERCEKSEKARKSITKRWDNYRDNTNVIRTYGDRNTIEEKRGKEKKEKTYNQDFLIFWKCYPKKIGKGAAWKSWQLKNNDRPSMDVLIAAIENQKRCPQWLKDGGQFVPNPATWLNQDRWEDEVVEVKPSW